MKQEFRYLADRAALNELAARPKPKIKTVEMLQAEDEFRLRVTFRQFVDEREGHRQTTTTDFAFPCEDTARDGLRALRNRGGFRFKEIGTNLKP